MRNTNTKTILRKFLLQLAQRNFSQVGTDKGGPEEMNVRNRLPRLQQIRPRQKLQA